MVIKMSKKRQSFLEKIFCFFVAGIFIFNSLFPLRICFAQGLDVSLHLPAVGQKVGLSQGYVPVMVKGLKVGAEHPLEFEFIIDPGDTDLSGEGLKEESMKLIKYFLATLTIPQEELWVNLSPYEKDRIVPQAFGLTQMGRDLLGQDYLLKQLTASLMYPQEELGKKFWDRVFGKARALYGTTDMELNTFNKIWIVPERAVVYEHQGAAFIVDSHLKVMLEEDYVSMLADIREKEIAAQGMQLVGVESSPVVTEIIREVIVPEIEREVNEGKSFANLRQIYHSMILAAWYKETLKESLLARVYADQRKVIGVDVEDKKIKEKIYAQYVEAFKKGVYNFIQEDYDPVTQEVIPRKYFSGGFAGNELEVERKEDMAQLSREEVKNTVPVGKKGYEIATWRAYEVGERGNAQQAERESLALPLREVDEAMLSTSDTAIRNLAYSIVGQYHDVDHTLEVMEDELAGYGLDPREISRKLSEIEEDVVRANIETTPERPGPQFAYLDEGLMLAAFRIDPEKRRNSPYQGKEKYQVIVKMPHFGKNFTRGEQLPVSQDHPTLHPRLERGYHIVKNILGSDLTAAIVLENVSLDIEGQVQAYPFVFVQREVETLGQLRRERARKVRAIAELEREKIILPDTIRSVYVIPRDKPVENTKEYQDEMTHLQETIAANQEDVQHIDEEIGQFIEEIKILRRKMAERGVFDLDVTNVENNYGRVKGEDRRVVVIDFDRLVYAEEAVRNLTKVVQNYRSFQNLKTSLHTDGQSPKTYEQWQELVFERYGEDWDADILLYQDMSDAPEYNLDEIASASEASGQYDGPMHALWAKALQDFSGIWSKLEKEGLEQRRTKPPFLEDVIKAQKDYLLAALKRPAMPSQESLEELTRAVRSERVHFAINKNVGGGRLSYFIEAQDDRRSGQFSLLVQVTPFAAEPLEGIQIILKDASGKEIASQPMTKKGRVIFPNLSSRQEYTLDIKDGEGNTLPALPDQKPPPESLEITVSGIDLDGVRDQLSAYESLTGPFLNFVGQMLVASGLEDLLEKRELTFAQRMVVNPTTATTKDVTRLKNIYVRFQSGVPAEYTARQHDEIVDRLRAVRENNQFVEKMGETERGSIDRLLEKVEREPFSISELAQASGYTDDFYSRLRGERIRRSHAEAFQTFLDALREDVRAWDVHLDRVVPEVLSRLAAIPLPWGITPNKRYTGPQKEVVSVRSLIETAPYPKFIASQFINALRGVKDGKLNLREIELAVELLDFNFEGAIALLRDAIFHENGVYIHSKATEVIRPALAAIDPNDSRFHSLIRELNEREEFLKETYAFWVYHGDRKRVKELLSEIDRTGVDHAGGDRAQLGSSSVKPLMEAFQSFVLRPIEEGRYQNRNDGVTFTIDTNVDEKEGFGLGLTVMMDRAFPKGLAVGLINTQTQEVVPGSVKPFTFRGVGGDVSWRNLGPVTSYQLFLTDVYDWDTEEQSLANIRGVFKEQNSLFWDDYDDYRSLGQEVKLNPKVGGIILGDLRKQVYAITRDDFIGLGLFRILDHQQIPFFEGSHEVALMRAFPELGLERSGFKSQRDRAMAAGQAKPPGGIDLNPAFLDLQIKRDDSGIPLPVSQQPITEMKIEGFIPVIIHIHPAPPIHLLLGISAEESVDQLSKRN